MIDAIEGAGATGCATCVFFRRRSEDEDEVYGTCRRFPPVLSPLSKQEAEQFEYSDDGTFQGRYEHDFIHWFQPAVTGSDWCGEHRSTGT